MKIIFLTALFSLLTIAGCMDKQQDYVKQQQGETAECFNYRMMAGAPMSPQAYASLKEKCAESIKAKDNQLK